MADVSVRPARAQDAERVAKVQLSTWRQAYPDLPLEVPEVEAAAVWLRAVEQPPSERHRLLVAMDGEDLVGFAASGPEEGEAELATLLVEPRWGRRGHGSRLLAATVDHWRSDGVTRAVAWLLERDAVSAAFLSSTGWAPDGRSRGLDTGARIERQVCLHCQID